jgi:hypothetical protein
MPFNPLGPDVYISHICISQYIVYTYIQIIQDLKMVNIYQNMLPLHKYWDENIHYVMEKFI